MPGDDKLKEMLMQLTENNTSADFTEGVMQRIEATVFASQKKSLLEQKGLQIIAAMFIIICIALLITSNFVNPIAIPFHVTIQRLMPYCLQMIYFLTAFWMVMLGNQAWNRSTFHSA